MKLREHFNRQRGRYYLILICTLVFILSTKGITDEGTVSMNGDMPKYLMNGAFFYDLVRDMPSSDLMGYAYRYFARYPALSLGHHPLLLGIAEVPFYYLFGISVFSARLTIVFFALLGIISWFLLIRSIYSDNIALLSSLLFITSPMIVRLSWEVMSEIPTLSLVITATY
jgi:4-amino-4-deoxy-L-arabinose transferase-like glycosyltransferase